MEEVVAEFRASGKSKNAFARGLGVTWRTLDRWCSLVPEDGGKADGIRSISDGLKLLPVRVTEPKTRATTKESKPMAEAGTLEIVSPGGWRLRVSSGVDAKRIRELLEVLSQC